MKSSPCYHNTHCVTLGDRQNSKLALEISTSCTYTQYNSLLSHMWVGLVIVMRYSSHDWVTLYGKGEGIFQMKLMPLSC